MILIYTAAVLSLLLLTVNPSLADALGVEDGVVEWLTAIFLLLGSLVMARHIWQLKQASDRKSLLVILSVLLAIALFVFAGEEISWGQRIFEIQTGEFMQEYNWQGETNIHNLHTDLFNIAFHYGAILFLIVMPIFRDKTSQLLAKIKLASLKHLIPPAWIAVPSFVIIGMLDPRFVHFDYKPQVAIWYLAALIIGLALLVYALFKAKKSKDLKQLGLLNLSLVLAAGLFLLAISGDRGISPNTISEYKEMVIAAALLSFTIHLSTNSAAAKKNPLRARSGSSSK